MRRLTITTLLAVLGLTGAGCTVATEQTTFDPALIADVGADRRGQPSDGGTDCDGRARHVRRSRDRKADDDLVQGKLANLSEQDIVAMARASRDNRKRFDKALAALDRDGAAIRNATVNVDKHVNSPTALMSSSRVWNASLAGNADRIHRMSTAFGERARRI